MTRATIRPLIAVGAAVCALALLLACGGDHGPPAGAPVRASTPTSAGRDKSLRLARPWSWTPPRQASAGMPAAEGQGIALTSAREDVVLLDPDGAEVWHAQRPGVRDVAPALTAELVLAATDDGVIAYDRATGKPRWETTLGERANTPVVLGTKAVVTTWPGSLVGLDLADGRVSWRNKLGGDALGPAAAAGATVVATFDSGLEAGAVAVDAASGRERWSVPVPAGAVSAPAVVTSTGTVVLVAADVAAHGLSVDDGSERWRRPIEGAGSPEVPPLPLPDGTVLVGHRLGGMAMLDARDGGILWEVSSRSAAVRGGPAGPGPKGWFVMPLHDGMVLFAKQDGVEETPVPGGLAVGVAAGPGGLLLLSTGQGDDNNLIAITGW